MKGFEHKHLETDSNFDTDGIDMSIDAEDTSFVFDILMNHMYRDPIGSVIREITSNCFDSHAEAGVDKPVVIDFGEDDGGEYITFTDFGVGISPDRMAKVYSKPAKSTKRGSNDQIGYWGLGSKSPLAYQDYFCLNTVSNGIKYEYVVHRGQKAPRIDKLDEYPVENTSNGTEVKIYFKETANSYYTEKHTFFKKLNEQLRYFDNVFVKNCASFNNDYKIHIGEHFKYRNDTPTDTDLHLCIGKVFYPIDWYKLGLAVIKFPAGLKFEIGDLPITPERESVRYGKFEKDEEEYDVAEIIKKKIEAFKAEIASIEHKINVEHNNLTDYYAFKSEQPYVTLLDKRLSVANLIPTRKHVYTPLEEIGLNVEDIPNLFFPYVCTHFLKVRIVPISSPYRLTYDKLMDRFVVRAFKGVKAKQVVLDYIRFLANNERKGSIIFIEPHEWLNSKQKARDIKDLLGLKGTRNYEKGLNYINTWKKFKAVVDTELYLNSIALEDIEVPEDWLKEWKRKRKTVKTGINHNPDEEIVVSDINSNLVKAYRKRAMRVDELPRYPFIIYGFSEQEEVLDSWGKLLYNSYEFSKGKVLLIKYKDQKYFLPLKNAIHVNYFMSNNPIFVKVASALLIDKSPVWKRYFHPLTSTHPTERVADNVIFSYIFEPFHKTVEELNAIRKNTVVLNAKGTEEFKEEIVNMAEQNDWIDPKIKNNLKKVEQYLEGTELLSYVVPYISAVPYIAEFLQNKGSKTDLFWTSPEPWQLELMEELQEKFNYMEDLQAMASSALYRVSYSYDNSVYTRRATRRDILTEWKAKNEDTASLITSSIKYHERRKENQSNPNRA